MIIDKIHLKCVWQWLHTIPQNSEDRWNKRGNGWRGHHETVLITISVQSNLAKGRILSCHPLQWQMDSSDLNHHLIHGCLGPQESAPTKWHLDRFSNNCTVHPCAQHTNTYVAMCNICSNRHPCMQCGLIMISSIATATTTDTLYSPH